MFYEFGNRLICSFSLPKHRSLASSGCQTSDLIVEEVACQSVKYKSVKVKYVFTFASVTGASKILGYTWIKMKLIYILCIQIVYGYGALNPGEIRMLNNDLILL